MLWKALQTHLFRGTQQLFCLKVLFFENWCPFHSFICCFNLLFLFVILDSVPLLTHHHEHVWHFFPLMVTIFIKAVLCICNCNVISNQTLGTYWSAHRFWKLSILMHIWTQAISLPWCTEAYDRSDIWLKNKKHWNWWPKYFSTTIVCRGVNTLH